MKLDELLRTENEWLKGEGPFANIAISTRVRLARNIKGHLYFDRADNKQREDTLKMLFAAVKKSKCLKDALMLEMKNVSDLDKQFLLERHLMSRNHMQQVDHKGLVLEEKEIVSAMLNEEDHLRLQVMQSGFNVTEAWKIADEIDSELSESLPFDYSNKFGYLTSCPTNTGTGLRASVMMHLSALAMTGQIDNVFEGISKLGLTMRGFYGEGTEALGDFFQISNQVALGHSEMDILDNLKRIINKLVLQEKTTRENLLSKRKEEVTDRVQRSYDTLKSANSRLALNLFHPLFSMLQLH